MLARQPTPRLQDHPLLAVRICIFNIFAATHHIGGRFSICNLRMHHAVLTGTHLSQPYGALLLFFNSRLLLNGCLLVSPDLDKKLKRFTSTLYE
jgi:hypothetical protein